MPITCLYEGRDLLGESPLWDSTTHTLYWVDAIKPALHALHPATGTHQEWPMPALIGAIALRKKGGLIASLGTGIAFIDLPSGQITMHKIVNEALSPVHLNDGKCDAAGRFWVGEVCHDKMRSNGRLFCLHPNGDLEVKANNLALFNGPCWSPCQRIFYFTDSFKRIIFRADFNLKTAEMGVPEPLIVIPEGDSGIPDGCTVDAEGYLWSAKWNGYRITRYAPNGKIDREFELPIQRPTSCIFGGENLDTLFITSASKDVGEPTPLSDPKAGQLFALQLTL